MKSISSKGLFFTSAIAYFVATAIGSDTVLGDGFRIIGVLCLLIGSLQHVREKRSTKRPL